VEVDNPSRVLYRDSRRVVGHASTRWNKHVDPYHVRFSRWDVERKRIASFAHKQIDVRYLWHRVDDRSELRLLAHHAFVSLKKVNEMRKVLTRACMCAQECASVRMRTCSY
jgi:hypothetical protein